MIPPHSTPEEQIAYLRKLADAFELIGKQQIPPATEDEWPFGDVLPLRAAADTIERLHGAIKPKTDALATPHP